MMHLPDLTDVVPTRRMSVARGVLSGIAPLEVDALVAARLAGVLAVKEAHRLVPAFLPVQATDIQCDLLAEGGALHCTVTVQAYARARLASAALCGVMGCLLAALESAGQPEGARIESVHVIQEVEP